MGIFNNVKDLLTSNFSDWIKINDNKTRFTIEDFPYATGVDEEMIKPHCALCISVNNCYFKNENDKKPVEFDYNLYSLKQIPFIKLNGIKDHNGEIFNLISSCMIFPNGKLNENTLVGGKI